jgi:hypothetical protein
MPTGHVTDPNNNPHEKSYGFLVCDNNNADPLDHHRYMYLKTKEFRHLTYGSIVEFDIINIDIAGTIVFDVAIIKSDSSSELIITSQFNDLMHSLIIKKEQELLSDSLFSTVDEVLNILHNKTLN